MKMIQSFDPSAAASGTFKHQVANPCGGVYLFNESNEWLQLTLPDGGKVGLPAWWARFYHLQDVQGPVLWQVLDSIATVASPLSKVYGESYERNEIVGRGFYDGPIPRNPYIANSVSSTVSTNQVVNDGNPAVSTVIEATQSGNTGGSNLFAGNDGSFYNAQWVSGVYTKLLELAPGANPILKFGAKLFLQAFDHAGANLSNILGIDSSGNTALQAHKTNNQILLYDKNGAVLATFDANHCLNLTGAIQTVNGDTGGSMTIQEIFAGGIKVTVVKQNNYRQAAATPQSITLKNAFTGPYFVFNGGCGGMQMFLAGVNQQANYFATVAAGGGTHSAQTAAQQDTFGWQNNGTDAVQSQGSYASAHTGVFVMIGF